MAVSWAASAHARRLFVASVPCSYSHTAPRRRSASVLAHSWTGGQVVDAVVHKRRVVVLMHGILGSKSNWNTPARKLLERIGPLGWRVLQVDHRAHGQSPTSVPPHTLEACASDVLETLHHAGVRPDDDELVLCGHSFGGKIALTFVSERLRANAPPPKMTWLFDSIPGFPAEQSREQQRREQSVSFVLLAVERAASKGVYRDRAALVDTLVEEESLLRPVAQWVAQSVRSVPGGVEVAYDMQTIRALYDAYRSTDRWDVLEGGQADFGVVVAGRNAHAWGPDNLARLENCGERVRSVTLDKAGHNVHVDDLPGLLEVLDPTFH